MLHLSVQPVSSLSSADDHAPADLKRKDLHRRSLHNLINLNRLNRQIFWLLSYIKHDKRSTKIDLVFRYTNICTFYRGVYIFFFTCNIQCKENLGKVCVCYFYPVMCAVIRSGKIPISLSVYQFKHKFLLIVQNSKYSPY